jgi:hypothetical protein
VDLLKDLAALLAELLDILLVYNLNILTILDVFLYGYVGMADQTMPR